MQRDRLLSPFWGRVNLLAGLAIVLLVIWAGLAEVDEAVKGTGRTVSSGENKLIQHLEGGIVSEILVEEGQIVSKGQILFRVRNESALATLRENELQLQGLQARILRLRAEIDEAQLAFPSDMRNAMPETIRNEQQLFESRRQKRFETIKILLEQIAQKKSILEEQTAKVVNLQTELDTATKQYVLVKKLVKSGAASTNRMLEIEGKVNRFNTELSSLTRTIPVTKSELGEVTGRLQETLATQKNELLEELHKAMLENNQLAERLKADRDMIIRTDLESPVKGIVNRIAVHTIGGIVRPGEIMAEITPIDEKVIVEARIAPEHRAKIWNSQRVKVKITAFAYATYGTVGGHILDISADSLTDDQTGAAYYRVKVALDRSTVGESKKIMPGMMTEVNILTGKRTVLDYLLRPLIRVSEQAFSEG